MGPVEKKLGRRVAERRGLSGLTQAELAEKVGVSTETISRLERGAALPSLTRLRTVAGALDVELHELFCFRERPSPKERALERLLGVLQRRSAEDVEAFTDIAKSILARWK